MSDDGKVLAEGLVRVRVFGHPLEVDVNGLHVPEIQSFSMMLSVEQALGLKLCIEESLEGLE